MSISINEVIASLMEHEAQSEELAKLHGRINACIEILKCKVDMHWSMQGFAEEKGDEHEADRHMYERWGTELCVRLLKSILSDDAQDIKEYAEIFEVSIDENGGVANEA